MASLLRSTEAQAVILLAVLLVLSVVAWYVVARFRDRNSQDTTASDLLTKFREMHQRGDLNQAEYRTIKGVLAEKIGDELNDGGETG
jgi:uncharacterized membrane protein